MRHQAPAWQKSGASEWEKRQALDRWVDHVMAAVEDLDTNVVPLRASRRLDVRLKHQIF
jgi:hypothetical protein